jgi:methylmalonyl-CoA mutase N-terminal domain/subunit
VDDVVAAPAIQRIDPAAERGQIDGLRRVRAERDAASWEAALARLSDVARGGENLLAPMIEAVAAYATLGEISDALRAAWGEHRELITV